MPQATSLTPDLSLIRDYTRADGAVHRPVACTHFSDGTKHLYDINAGHVAGTDNATCKTIERAIEAYRPELVIIEGVPTRLDVYSSDYTDYLKRQAALHFKHGEPDFAAALAKQKNIQFIGGEPTDREVTEAMQAKGYAPKETMAFYALRWIPQDRREGLAMDEAAFAGRMHKHTAECFSFVPEKDRLSFDEFKAWYDKHNTTGKPFLAIENNDVAPFASADATTFQKMSADTGRVREKHLDRLIADSFKDRDRVLAIYGDGHLQISWPVYEKMLGKGEAHILAPESAQRKPGVNIDIEVAQPGASPIKVSISISGEEKQPAPKVHLQGKEATFTDIRDLTRQVRELPSGFDAGVPATAPPSALNAQEDAVKQLWLAGKYDDAISGFEGLLAKAKQEKDYNAAGRAAEMLHDATCDWLIAHRKDSASVPWQQRYAGLADIRRQSVDDFKDPNQFDPSAFRVAQGSVGFSGDAPIGTDGVHQCIAVFVRNPETHKTALAHVACETDGESLTRAVDGVGKSSRPLQVRLLGAKFPEMKNSEENLQKVLGVLSRYDTNILSADVLDRRASQPTSAVVDPKTFVLSAKAPGIDHPDVLIEAATSARQGKELRTSFDLTQSPERHPVLMSAGEIAAWQKQWERTDLETYAELKRSTPPRYLATTVQGEEVRFGGRIQLQEKMRQAYDDAFRPVAAAFSERMAERKKQGIEMSETQMAAMLADLRQKPIYLGENAQKANAALIDFARSEALAEKKAPSFTEKTPMRNGAGWAEAAKAKENTVRAI